MPTSELARPSGFLGGLNSRWHHRALAVFMVIVIGHWAEHIAQAFQIYALGWPTAKARGVLGIPFPALISSEWLHYGYALVMLVFLWILRHGFAGRSRQWWNLALAIQFWHHIEHLLLFVQAQSGWRLAGQKVPTSIIQLLVPRVELHLFYNTIVTIPMIVAVVLHRRASAAEHELTGCTCGLPKQPALAAS
ncbi:hypothetical protein [Amycolatopsis australiensis]|uniref:Uncharacterized protein n=1 Tax=Amycolatopsis australiensis TaxID=546364 RepID=A0A1K1RK02_9PSEU|nr:hypothetical protein [Amycolatopsis australiensis]SFW72172.1 hypothetical protein SAMN04489730_3399 [Amycolatopsis australiensis]